MVLLDAHSERLLADSLFSLYVQANDLKQCEEPQRCTRSKGMTHITYFSAFATLTVKSGLAGCFVWNACLQYAPWLGRYCGIFWKQAKRFLAVLLCCSQSRSHVCFAYFLYLVQIKIQKASSLDGHIYKYIPTTPIGGGLLFL